MGRKGISSVKKIEAVERYKLAKPFCICIRVFLKGKTWLNRGPISSCPVISIIQFCDLNNLR